MVGAKPPSQREWVVQLFSLSYAADIADLHGGTNSRCEGASGRSADRVNVDCVV